MDLDTRHVFSYKTDKENKDAHGITHSYHSVYLRKFDAKKN